MKIMITFITLFMLSLFSTGVFAGTSEDRVRTLEETLKKQEQTIQEIRGLQEILRKRTIPRAKGGKKVKGFSRNL